MYLRVPLKFSTPLWRKWSTLDRSHGYILIIDQGVLTDQSGMMLEDGRLVLLVRE
jgi:hypothetical protein